jgi:hypothetical protein
VALQTSTLFFVPELLVVVAERRGEVAIRRRRRSFESI